MNKVILIGRLARDPEVRYNPDNTISVARYSLAVDRAFKREGEPSADFLSCVAFGRAGEFAEKYLRKGIKIAVVGRLQTGSYTNRDGVKVYTTDIIIEQQEFAESKASSERASGPAPTNYTGSSADLPAAGDEYSDGFMNIPDSIEEDLPFH